MNCVAESMCDKGLRKGRVLATWAAVAFLCISFATRGAADNPVSNTYTLGLGGDSVTGAGQWSVVTDAATCETQIFRLDYVTMDWASFATLSPILPAITCPNGAFGRSSSLAGDVLVVGIPEWDDNTFGGGNGNNYGGLAIFTFDGSTWDREGGYNSGLGFVLMPPDPLIELQGAFFGESVSVSQSPSSPDEYLIVVGAPGFDAGGSLDTGKVYAYRYNSATNTVTLILEFESPFTGDQVGFSVTTDYPYFLIGGPGIDDNGNGFIDSGGAALFLATDTNPADGVLDGVSPADDILYGPAAGVRAGVEVSMSAEFVLLAGDGTNAIAESWVFENVGSATVRDYSIVSRPPFLTSNTVTGGDVTQSAGIGAHGYIIDSGLGGGAKIARDPISNSNGNLLSVDVSGTPGGNVTEVGFDIRLVRESLWLANPTENRAIVNEYPAGFGALQNAFIFAQRNIPCNATGVTVNDAFGYLGTASTDGINGNYAVYAYDTTNVTSGRPYELLQGTDNLPTNNTSLWLVTDSTQWVSMADCTDYTPSSFVASPGPGLPSQIPVAPERVKAQTIVFMPEPALDLPSGETFARVMVNNPYPREVYASDIRYQPPTGSGSNPLSLDLAQPLYLAPTLYVYDESISVGQKYRAITSVGTPPFEDRIQAHEGFWIQLNAGAVGSGDFILMPQTE